MKYSRFAVFAGLLLAAGTGTHHSQMAAAENFDLNTPPPRGVYGCYSARATYGAPGCVKPSVGRLGVKIEVAPS